MEVDVSFDTTGFALGVILDDIELLVKSLLEAPTAPECRAIADGFTLLVSDFNQWSLNVGYGVITFSRRVAEVYWIAANVYTRIYRSHVEGRPGDIREIVLPASPDMDHLRTMLRWLMDNGPRGGINEMEHDFPLPVTEYEPGTSEEFIHTITLYAVGFHLLHELAHQINPINQFPDSIAMERACDLQAVHWLLDGRNIDSEDGRARLIGSALAFLLFTVEVANNNIAASVTHPACYDRLHDVISEIADENVDVVWGFVSSMVAMHMDVAGIQIGPIPQFANFYELFLTQREAIRAHVDPP